MRRQHDQDNFVFICVDFAEHCSAYRRFQQTVAGPKEELQPADPRGAGHAPVDNVAFYL